MAMPPSLPHDAPFAARQIAALNDVLRDLTGDQRHWLSGFLAAHRVAAPDPPGTTRPTLSILYASESGNAEALAMLARRKAAKLGFAAKVADVADMPLDAAARTTRLLVVASTWGEGDPPQRAIDFCQGLAAKDAPSFADTHYAVLALGDRAYVNFCQTGRDIDDRLSDLGGRRIAARTECDLDYAAQAESWLDAALASFANQAASAPPATVPASARPARTADDNADDDDDEGADDSAAVAELEITDIVNLNGSRSDGQTMHVELALDGRPIAYEPGDSLAVTPRNDPALVERVLRAAGLAHHADLPEMLCDGYDVNTITRPQLQGYAGLTNEPRLADLLGNEAALTAFLADHQLVDLLEMFGHDLDPDALTGLLRPMAPRLYSVASSRKATPDEAHLLVGLARHTILAQLRHGVTSSHIAHRRAAGQVLRVGLRRNRHFRLPADPDRPIVMVGAGTGAAPFRGFLQERDAIGARGRNWLFFGNRRFTHDFLYQLEWQDFLARGVLTRLDLAFSRDQPRKVYVQHRMWERRAELYAWLQDGAVFYVCGDAKRMARDVHDTLLRIGADIGGLTPDAAHDWVSGLRRDGRYLRDIY